jgi:HK97 family phage portal protein
MTLTDRLFAALRGQQRALTPQQIFGTDWQDIIGNTSGERVDHKTAVTLAAVWAAVRLLSQDIATLPFHSITVQGNQRIPVDPQPEWLGQPKVSDANYTLIDYLSEFTISLLVDGNAFVLALPSVSRPFELTVLNPQQVEVKRQGGQVTYTIRDERRNVIGVETADRILHAPWFRYPGDLRGVSPVQKQEELIGRGLAAQEISARFFRQGHVFGGIVEVPRDTDASKEDIAKMLADLNKRHGGHRKAWVPGALTGGATFRETFMKPQDSQLLETERWIREQVGMAYGVPPFLMGSLEPGAVSYASTEQQGIVYKQSGIRPLSERIEHAHRRLLPPGQQMKFNLDGLLRADFKTRTEGYRELWQIGVLKPNEIRAKEDMAPLPDEEGGNTAWVPLNMAPAEVVKKFPLPSDLPARPGPEQGEQPADEQE